jgi:hypothetical protein
VNQNVTLTAIVTPAATGAVATPTGMVNFYDGTTLLNTTPVSIALAGGSYEADFQTNFSTQGAHSITAVFTTGDNNYFGSTSPALAENIETAPAVTGVAPASGPAAGGTTVTITGTNFTGATSVSFGGVAAAGFTVISATSMTATSPAGAGMVDVVVTNPFGSSVPGAGDRFTYVPTITVSPTTLPVAEAGVTYSQTISAGGGAGSYTYAVSAGTLPAGLTLSSMGVLSGKPATGGTFSFTVTATDANNFTGSKSYMLTVNAVTITVSAATLAPATLPPATVGMAYSQMIAASGGTGPYTYAVSAGTLPAGLTLSSAGALSGTPTTGGMFSFTVTATDSSASPGPYKGMATYSLTVNAAAATLDFTFTNVGTAAYTATPGAVASYNFALAPLNGSYPGTVSLSVTGLPAGAAASFTPSSVAVGGGATPVGMTVQTASGTAQNNSPFGRGLMLAFVLLPFVAKRRVREKLKGHMLLLVLLMAGMTAVLTGCGSTNGFLQQNQQTYTLTVTATSGTLAHSQTVTLIVQ